MSHKRVVEKKGKKYGPYVYESYRDTDGAVRKRYLGKHVEQKKDSAVLWQVISLVLLVIIVLILLTSVPTGRVSLSLENLSSDGEMLRGNLFFVLQQSELIPSSTDVIISNGGNKYMYSLQELVNEEEMEGDFFVIDQIFL